MFMRRIVIICALSLVATQALAAEVKGTSAIDAVTVYPAGAEITRIGRVAIERGEHTLLFTDLPADAVSSSIRVEGKATGKLEIGSVDTRIVQVARSDEQATASERRRVEQDIEKLRDERALLQATIQAAEIQKRLVDNLAQMPARPQPAGTSAVQPDWNQLFTLIGQRGAEAQKTVLETQIKARETDRQIKDLEGKLASLAPSRRARTEVKVSVAAAAPLEADIVIRYQVRRAAWTPYYDARLSTGTKTQAPKLQLVRRASIEQRSGESWENIALSLSTARPSAGTAAPLLSALVVDFESERPPPPAPAARPAPTSGLRNAPMARRSADLGDDRLEAEAIAADEVRAKVEVQAFQAIYGIAGRVTVPDTGETKRVQIDTMELDPALAVRAVPRRDEKAYLYAKVTVARGTPLLPGNVSLFRDATFVGNGSLPLLAPGEQHELGFGVDDAVRVRYAIAEEKRGETGIISSSKTDTRSYRITAKNLHPRPIALTVLDQIPVSLNADIKIDLIGKSVPSRRDVDDKRGVMAWDATLAPDEERVIEFGYRATWPAGKNVTYGQGS